MSVYTIYIYIYMYNMLQELAASLFIAQTNAFDTNNIHTSNSEVPQQVSVIITVFYDISQQHTGAGRRFAIVEGVRSPHKHSGSSNVL